MCNGVPSLCFVSVGDLEIRQDEGNRYSGLPLGLVTVTYIRVWLKYISNASDQAANGVRRSGSG